jgi:hypothetical protein
MTQHELTPCPFDRRIVGPHGAILLRQNHDHAKQCVTAIRRRTQPHWSQLKCDYEVAA